MSGSRRDPGTPIASVHPEGEMTGLRVCLRTLSNPSAYAKGQWYALGICATCYAVDTWALYATWQNMSPANDRHYPFVWAVEVALALVATALLYFAFSDGSKENVS